MASGIILNMYRGYSKQSRMQKDTHIYINWRQRTVRFQTVPEKKEISLENNLFK